ncbi:MAG TPA: hypothetical protein VE959_21410 [Bryobacteraceae bacterium]|nr:hypothetical protein [Bryobacteraceae bacterium]
MACPYFDPREPRARAYDRSSAMLPLGDMWAGTCRAVADEPWQPDETRLRRLCNPGYARDACARFPSDDGPDAVRFAIRHDNGTRLGISWVAERDHHPFAHGALDYSLAEGAFVEGAPGGAILRQARAYVGSYLRRKAEASGE